MGQLSSNGKGVGKLPPRSCPGWEWDEQKSLSWDGRGRGAGEIKGRAKYNPAETAERLQAEPLAPEVEYLWRLLKELILASFGRGKTRGKKDGKGEEEFVLLLRAVAEGKGSCWVLPVER